MYTYDALDNLLNVTQNAQSGSTQTRTFTYDGLGRLKTEATPETNGVAYSYTFDTDATCGTSNGDLVKRSDPAGGVTCYTYDSLHRAKDITYSGGYASATDQKHFVYDSATVNGTAMTNAKARVAEAYTGTSGAKITDLGFSYSLRGEVTDVHESTPHSGGYYHVTGSYWANGLLNALNTRFTGLPGWTFTPDGEGRATSVSATSGQNPVTATTYNVFSLPTGVTYGSADSDAFGIDSNTGRMTQYKSTVNSSAAYGTLTWNANGSLGQLAITDPFNAANNAQTCGYIHDDLARIGHVDCGSGKWGQSFAYDPFGNISKSVLAGRTGTSFLPLYSSSTNRYAQIGSSTPTYDANGNPTWDTFHYYAWDSEGKLKQVDSGAAVLTYDALGRRVEQNKSSVYTQIVYGPDGSKLALMSGQTVSKVFVPLPGSGTAVYNSSGLSYYRHSDWLGSSRLASTSTRTVYYDTAYNPFGEPYAETGATDRDFTGQNQDLTTDEYDFLYREYHAAQGRWVSESGPGGDGGGRSGSAAELESIWVCCQQSTREHRSAGVVRSERFY